MQARQRVLDFGPSDHFATLHGGHPFPVAVATRSAAGDFRQYVYGHDDAMAMLIQLAGSVDLNTYLSQSGFAVPGGRRTIGQVRALTSWWVDLDHYKLAELANIDAERLLDIALERFPWLPMPTLHVESGRGCYLVWVFDKPVAVERLADWQAVEDRLVAMLEPLGADRQARDAARILRVAGSFHVVAGERVTARRVGDAVSFERMRQLILERAPVDEPRSKGRYQPPVLRAVDGAGQARKRTGKALQAYQLALDRMADYRRLAELRGGRLADHRHRFLYCYAQAASWFAGSLEQLRDELEEFSDAYFADAGRYRANLVKSVIERFLDDACGKIVRLPTTRDAGRYRFSNRYIIGLLAITPDEQRHLRTVIGSAEKLRRLTEKRRASGIMSREQYRDRAEKRRAEAFELRAEGLSIREAAERLGVSVGAVAGYLRK